uniref:Minor structural protein n=1 Tax=Norovirus Hu/CHN42973/CZ05 TaxID=462121 RepID=C6ZCT6_NORV|nr:minor structural protein [Norovirus Hu/CHN42973/CZ05]
MAGAFLANLAGGVASNGIGSLINAGANAINQKVEYDFNKQLQSASFAHDKEMLQAQIQATSQLQRDMMAIKQEVLTAGGFSHADAARGAVGAPMTKLIDWSGTRYWAPNSMRTTGYSGTFTSQAPPQFTPYSKGAGKQSPSGAVSPSISSGSSVSSLRTQSTSLPSNRTMITQSSGLSSSSRFRTSDWVRSQNERMSPFMDGALHTAFVSPPSSRASSSGTVSTVPKEVLDSWTPMFNTHRQPLFAHLRRRGESQI